MRVVSWFSCGAASAVATKLLIEEFKNKFPDHELVIAYTLVKDEHPDSMRFLKECEEWFKHPITILQSKKYKASVDEVIKQTKYMSGVRGARCTQELKKAVRKEWQRFDDIHVFGMDCDEEHRIDQLLDGEPDLEIYPILIEHGISKADCFEIIKGAGIELPEMYKLGYNNNNCIGCLKATGAGYWNKIRRDFPDVFEKRAEQERLLGLAGMCKISENKLKKQWPEVIKKMKKENAKFSYDRNSLRIPLRYLPDNAGSHKDLDIGSCGFFCELKQ